MELILLLEILGSTTGVMGALIMAVRAKTHAHYAWSFWLVSSISLVAMASMNGMYSLMGMQVVFTVINIIGLKNSLKNLREMAMLLNS